MPIPFVLPDVEAGMILMWSGSIATIPSGFVLCDGTHGTPDLRDRFIVAAKQDDAGVAKTNITGALTKSGGSTTHTHGIGQSDAFASDGETADTAAAADSASHLPSYYALAYIMKT